MGKQVAALDNDERGNREVMIVAESQGGTTTGYHVDYVYNTWDQLLSETRTDAEQIAFWPVDGDTLRYARTNACCKRLYACSSCRFLQA